MKQQIISIGGCAFAKVGSSQPSALSSYFLEQTEKDRPKICFIPTASADDAKYTMNFYEEFTRTPCYPSHLSLFLPPTRDIEGFLLEKDAIFIGGGNTKNMLVLWREWGVDRILKKAYDNGVVLGGVSAGMNCWYEECVTDSLFGELSPLPCLGFLKGSACPHYDGEEMRRPSYQAFIKNGKMKGGIAIEDFAAAHYVNGEIVRVITEKSSTGYTVSLQDGAVVEKRLQSVTLRSQDL